MQPHEKFTLSGPNREVIEAIDRHCYGSEARDYALLIDGPWGSGKTYLLDRFFAEKRLSRSNDDPSIVPLRISLYGITSAAEISDALFAALHPLLSSKIGRLGGAVIKGLFKTALKIDFGELHETNKTSVTLGGVDLTDIGPDGKPQQRIIVFDDFERAILSPVEILAAIHPLIETGENRILILTNEQEICGSQAEDAPLSDIAENYRRIKEKTVGFTLKIKPDFDAAFTCFLSEQIQEHYRQFLQAARPEIETLATSEHGKNLRVLRRMIAVFGELFSAIEPQFRTTAHFAVLREMIRVVYVAFIETRQLGTSISQFQNCATGAWTNREMRLALGGENNTDAESRDAFLNTIFKRYGQVNLANAALSYTALADLVGHATVDTTAINQTIAEDPRFREPSEAPSWLKVWNYARNEPDLTSSIAEFRTDFDARRFKDLECLHACAIYLTLARVGEPAFIDGDAKAETKKYIEETFKGREVLDQDIQHSRNFNRRSLYMGAFGHTYSESDTPEFKEIFEYYCKVRENWIISALPARAAELFTMAKYDVKRFRDVLIDDHSMNPIYICIPILHLIDAAKFASFLIQASANDRDIILYVLRMRFQRVLFHASEIKPEAEWYQTLCDAVSAALPTASVSPLYREGLRISFAATFDAVKENRVKPTVP
ncbi:P-loop NTPase fold protein [Asaia sp. HN010]|uniref:P-loop NTPase fold protein n=1 Tax=Asaia sp. HN010 TaxID=3081233 RepID=UPI003016CBCE